MTSPFQALTQRYERLVEDAALPPFGFSTEKISYALVLSADGEIVDVDSLLDTGGKKPRPRSLLVPQPAKRTSGVASNFLWDKTAYVLGASAVSKRPAQEHAAFVDLHEQLLDETSDEGLVALLRFLRAWSPERFHEVPHADEVLDTVVVFRLDGELRFMHDRPDAQQIWAEHLAAAAAEEATCLVTGRRARIARLHPPIKGVAGAQSAGASIVSFNQEAFTSYGNEQGANAPVSERAAFAYTTALNALLARDSGHSVRLADTTIAFWADTPAAESLARGLFDPPAPDEKGEAAKIRDVLEEMAKGRALADATPDVAPDARFYLLGLAPNAARLSVRFWLDTTMGELAARFQQHWRDLRIEPEPWGARLPALWRLLYELAAQRKAENVPAQIAGELTRAVLTGARYPRSLLSAALMRLRADHDVNGRRVAIIKACLVRDARLSGRAYSKEDFVSLDPNGPPAYQLGRLFAVLETVQRSALGRINATIRDRYYGAASATPAAVFPLLVRNANHHLALLRKTKGGWAHTLDRRIGEIIETQGTAWPRALGIEDQGRFAIGYYHERFGKHSPIKDAPEPETTDAETIVDED